MNPCPGYGAHMITGNSIFNFPGAPEKEADMIAHAGFSIGTEVPNRDSREVEDLTW